MSLKGRNDTAAAQIGHCTSTDSKESLLINYRGFDLTIGKTSLFSEGKANDGWKVAYQQHICKYSSGSVWQFFFQASP